VGNGLDALSLILEAYGIGRGAEVIVPGYTFIATFIAVTRVGAIAVPVDVDEDTFNLDPDNIRSVISSRTRAIIPVHLFGQPADMERIGEIAREHDLKVIEDAAQAHGATLGAGRAGSLGDAAAFSFYPVKNLAAYGDGGAITTDDADLADRLRRLRNYGSAHKYLHTEVGVNSRLDELQAAFLRVNLAHLDTTNDARARIAARYTSELESCAPYLRLPRTHPRAHPVWHQYVVRTDTRDGLQRHLAERSIQTLIHYPAPPHRQPAYASDEKSVRLANPLPVSERLAETSLSLPMHAWLEADEQAAVIDAVRTFPGPASGRSPTAPKAAKAESAPPAAPQTPPIDARQSRIEAYTSEYLEDYAFESTLVAARQEVALELITRERPKTVLEVGCGAELLYTKAVARGLPIDAWLIVEPSRDFADRARRSASPSIGLRVIDGFFEDVALNLARPQASVDMVIISSLLHELSDPDGALLVARQVLGGAGILHVTVPNAGSLHRRLAMAMGLMSSLDELSHRNRALAQPRVYDRDSIRVAVVRGGFSVVDEGGYFMKPFTNAQMTAVMGILPEGVADGLMQLGRDYPDLASEIFVNARPAPATLDGR
jgi:dTDP-4-amino-4,6-dideoxygalactose transaminase/SAM-dependent methyltransferase